MKKLIRIFAFFSIAILLNAIPSIAQAQFPPHQSCPYKTLMSPPSTIAFDPGVPDGTVLWSGNLQTNYRSSNASTGGYVCPSSAFNIHFEGTTPYLGNNLYTTGIPGISYRFKMTGPTTGPIIYPSCFLQKYFPHICWINELGAGMTNHTLSVELIKTGSITGGGALSGVFAHWFVQLGRSYATYSWGGSVVIQPTIPTCKVSMPSIAVRLRDVNVNVFTGVGKTSPSQPFDIVLQCSGGNTGTSTDVYTTLTDQTDPSNVSDTLSLTKDSTASGVGIQVLNGTTVIKYGPDSSAAGNKNQWKAGSAGNGTFTIPLTARYIQTTPSVKAGTANGRATFTMNYQ